MITTGKRDISATRLVNGVLIVTFAAAPLAGAATAGALIEPISEMQIGDWAKGALMLGGATVGAIIAAAVAASAAAMIAAALIRAGVAEDPRDALAEHQRDEASEDDGNRRVRYRAEYGADELN